MPFPQVGQTIYGGWTQEGEQYADLKTRFSGYNTKAAGLVCDSVADDFAKLNLLVNTTMQPGGGRLDVVGVPRIGTNITIPANVTLKFIEGAYLAPDGGVTVTHNGKLKANKEKIFGGGGTIAFGPGKVRRLFPQWWGADDTGTVESLAAVQAAIAAAEAFIPVMNVYAPDAPQVALTGKFKTSGSIVLSRPIEVSGSSEHTDMVLPTLANVPAFLINLTVAQSTYVRFGIQRLSIVGLNAGASYAVQDNADGVKVTGISDVTPVLRRLRIIGMTGNGIHLHDKNNSPVITDCVIELNSKAGIRANGTFCTNAWIKRNIVRENRIGIQYKSDGGSFLTSGRISENLIESNNGRTVGTLGTADMPSVGIWLYKTQDLEIRGNYCENHANDLYLEGQTAHCNLHDNQWTLGNSWDLATLYGPPVRQMGVFVDNSGGSCVYNDFHENIFYGQPTKPAGCSAGNWNTAGFGATYGHVTDTAGINKYRFNHTFTPDNGQIQIDFGAVPRHTIINTPHYAPDGTGRAELVEQVFRRRETYQYHEWSNTELATQILRILPAGLLELHRQLQSPTHQLTYRLHEEVTDGATTRDIESRNSYGFERRVWSDLATARGWVEVLGTAPPVAGGRPADVGGGNWLVGDKIWNTVQGQGGALGWICIGAGSPGTWLPMAVVQGGSGNRGDNNIVLVTGDFPTNYFNTALTANRTVTLPANAASYDGQKFRIVRVGLGAFTLTVQDAAATALKVMPGATAAFVDVEYSSAAGGWKLVGYGTL